MRIGVQDAPFDFGQEAQAFAQGHSNMAPSLRLPALCVTATMVAWKQWKLSTTRA